MVSKNIERLYNIYLAVSRSSQNKPFKLRKDFSDFYETEQFVLIKKLERFFDQHPGIKPEIFFKAPYALHPDQVFDLSFYTSLKGVKCYTMYIKTLHQLPFDHDYHLNFIKQSLKFIKSFCNEQTIQIPDYSSFTANNTFPAWYTHIKDRCIDPVVMFGFQNTKQIMEQVETDITHLLIGDFNENFYSDLSKFNNSAKAKLLVIRGLKLIQNQ